MSDLIDRQTAIDELHMHLMYRMGTDSNKKRLDEWINNLPSAQSDIIRCNACKHWTQTTGNMPGFGLGDCDYLDEKLISCNGYCYWAERREE